MYMCTLNTAHNDLLLMHDSRDEDRWVELIQDCFEAHHSMRLDSRAQAVCVTAFVLIQRATVMLCSHHALD